MRAQIAKRVGHAINQQFMQSCLIDNAMCEFRQAQTRIRHFFLASDILRIGRVWFPEGILPQLIGFFHHHIAAVKGFHNFNGAA